MTIPRLLTPLFALALAIGGTVSPAAADDDSGGTVPPLGGYSLRIHSGTSTEDPILSEVSLACYIPGPGPLHGGSHPTPNEACASLTRAWGDFEQLPQVSDVGCPDVWDPVTVVADGYWHHQPSNFQQTYSNTCDAAVETDNVFRF